LSPNRLLLPAAAMIAANVGMEDAGRGILDSDNYERVMTSPKTSDDFRMSVRRIGRSAARGEAGRLVVAFVQRYLLRYHIRSASRIQQLFLAAPCW
jgi:hypothetical protein